MELNSIDDRLLTLEVKTNTLLDVLYSRDAENTFKKSHRVRVKAPRQPRVRYTPECHPDRPYYAKGLCKQCYKTNYKRLHGVKPRVTRYADCHPDRKHYIKGKCYQCWHREYMRNWRRKK